MTTTPELLFEIEGLSKFFLLDNHNTLKAVRDLSLTIAKGETVGIVGESGCGKSTLLAILAGAMKPDGGKILYQGKPVDNGRYRRETGYVPQGNPLLEELTVQDNLKLWYKGSEKEWKRERDSGIIAVLELGPLLKTAAGKLSGGMKQRVAIARAYAVNPQVLLMDEPFGALDAQTRTQLQSELIKTWQEQKKTCFFITHDVEEAVILATKVIIMSARPGRVKKIVDINLPYPRTQEMKMEMPFLDLKSYIWGEVYQEYLEVRK